MSEPWEDGFDTWTPRAGAAGETDTDTDIDRVELLRLARELAAQRNVEQEQSRRELEALKESLRERASAVAERERELTELQKQLEKGKPLKASKPQSSPDTEALAARERAALERLQAVEARERELQARAAELAAESEQLDAIDVRIRVGFPRGAGPRSPRVEAVLPGLAHAALLGQQTLTM
jgi:septal ring factor EnvC (AmiA/AmiB activator)